VYDIIRQSGLYGRRKLGWVIEPYRFNVAICGMTRDSSMSVVDSNHLCVRLLELAHDMASKKSSRAGYCNPLRAKVGQQFKFSVFPRHVIISFPPNVCSAPIEVSV
jgi:hypothetical protein